MNLTCPTPDAADRTGTVRSRSLLAGTSYLVHWRLGRSFFVLSTFGCSTNIACCCGKDRWPIKHRRCLGAPRLLRGYKKNQRELPLLQVPHCFLSRVVAVSIKQNRRGSLLFAGNLRGSASQLRRRAPAPCPHMSHLLPPMPRCRERQKQREEMRCTVSC